MTGIDAAVLQCAASQGGLIRRDQLRRLGVTADVLARMKRQGLIAALTSDVFLIAGVREGSAIRDQAALWQAGPRAALSHASAGVRWSLPRFAAGTVEVVVPHGTVRPTRTIGRVHVSRSLGPDDVVLHDGVRVTTPVRTVVDLVTRCTRSHLEACLLDLRRRSLVDLTELAASLSSPERPQVAGIDRLAAVAHRLVERPISESWLEDQFFALLAPTGVPMPVGQVVISAGGKSYRVDGLWSPERLIVELDGHEYHSSRADRRTDAERAAHLTGAGYGLIRFTYDDVVGRPRYVLDTVRHHLALRQRSAA